MLLFFFLVICVCTAEEHASDHLHALHCCLRLTLGSGAVVVTAGRNELRVCCIVSDTNVYFW